MMLYLLHILLLAACATAAGTPYQYNLQALPKRISVIPRVMANFSTGYKWWPDGKISAYRQNPANKTSDFIMHFVFDFNSRSPDQFVDSITEPAGINASYQNPDRLDRGVDVNMAELRPRNGTLLPPDVTGLLDDKKDIWATSAQVTQKNKGWMFNIFRLAETSQPGVSTDKMIGFSHVEWHWGNCVYKWIGVRYSDDNGLSWTTPVPIITKGRMNETCAPYVNPGSQYKNVGTGDFAAAWDASNRRWVIFATDDWLYMVVSDDALGTPGKWTRIKPGYPDTAPGLIGNGGQFAHPDLTGQRGSNPSIIKDTKNGVWHMAFSPWNGGVFASTSSNLVNWSGWTELKLNVNNTWHPRLAYPSLIGNEGDQLTTDGQATLYFTDQSSWTDSGRIMWAAPLKFQPVNP